MMRAKEQQMNNPQMPPEQEAELLKNYLSGQMPATIVT